MPISLTETYFLMASSLAMSSIVIANAYYQKQQFYPLVVYVTKSNASMAIIYVQGLVLVLLLGKLIGKIFFGQLRTAEVEHLIERSWYAVTETCLAFTVFRDDLSPKFVALFTLLLFLKCFHWLAEDRVDYMERSPNISMFFHMRVISLLSILGCLDITFVYLAYHSTLSKGASVQLVFGFEYAILFAVIINISMKYILHFFDLYNENPWEDKAIYLLYTELIMGLLKIGLYFIFILIMMKIHTFPLFAIRPMYLTIRGFKKALNDVIMSRRAIRNMNTFYPDATAQDIENSDNVCIICRENMVGNGSCKKLPCNHIFHISCLRSWFQRQQTCPTCRMDVLRVASTSSGANMPNQGNNNANNANNVNNANLNGQAPVPPFFAANPFVVQQLNQLMQRQNGNQPPAGNVQQAAPTPGTSGSHSSTAQASTPRVVLSPAMFPFLQSPPFPMPEVSIETLLQGFTDEQLHALEGQERRQIEARLKCLMDVKTLITAATIRLQQYNNVVLNSPPTSAISTQTEPKPEEPRNETTSNNESTNIAASSLQNSQDGGSSLTESGDQASASTSSEDSKEMIRQRRLQRFSQTQLPNLSDTPSPASDNVAQ